MEVIKNYLENMFANLPNTPEVQRAKNELWQMMEDKYNELIAEGKNDNEAVGTVIMEFGNLDEISEDIGIHNLVPIQEQQPLRKKVTMDEAKQYLHDKQDRAYKLALGVALCILSPVGYCINEMFHMTDIMGFFLLIGCIAVAVILFVYSSVTMQRWEYLKQEPCAIDFATTNYIHEQKEHYRTNYALLLSIGIALCIISVIPSTVFDEYIPGEHVWEGLEALGSLLLFIFVAAGVFMIVLTSSIRGGFDELLKLNSAATVGGNFVSSQHPETQYISPAAATVMSVYWTTITCVYLIWSFLSFDWWYTWIIWPVAAIIHSVLKNAFKK